MKMTMKLYLLISLIFAFAGVQACKAEKKSETKEDGADANPSNTPYPTYGSDDGGDDGDCHQSSGSDDDDDDDSSDDSDDDDDSFDLVSSSKPTWDDDIKDILESKCVSCHSSGGKSPNLTSYSTAKSKASKIWSEIESESMPPSGKSQLTSSQKSKIEKWVDNGAPEDSDDTSSDDSSDDSDDSSHSSGSSDCGDDDDSDDGEDDDSDDSDDGDTVADWDDFLNPKALKDCEKKDKIYDRKSESCHRATIASFSCTKDGIVKAFEKVGVKVSSQLSTNDDDGYEIDQCGEYKKMPVVLFYKKDKSSSTELKLKLRVICKKGTEACTAD